MCFGQGQSIAFAAIGLAVSAYLRRKGFSKMAYGVFFFFTMELLQAVQYSFIDQCDNPINKVLTIVGFAHICLQPFFTHLMTMDLVRSEKTRAVYRSILSLCLISGALFFSRWLMSPWAHDNANFGDQCAGTFEWIRGSPEDGICTYRGLHHLAWRIPFYEQTYFTQGTSVHSFMMFAPFFVTNKANWIPGVFLFLTGPFLASYISPNLHEQASIWCFFSISQICFMLFAIRKVLASGMTKYEYETAQKLASFKKVHTKKAKAA